MTLEQPFCSIFVHVANNKLQITVFEWKNIREKDLYSALIWFDAAQKKMGEIWIRKDVSLEEYQALWLPVDKKTCVWDSAVKLWL